jgi:hypothetical protein
MAASFTICSHASDQVISTLRWEAQREYTDVEPAKPSGPDTDLRGGKCSSKTHDGRSGKKRSPFEATDRHGRGICATQTLAANRAWMQAHAHEEPSFVALSQGFGPEQAKRWFSEMVDFGAVREAAMEEAGITTLVLLLGLALK